MLSSFWPFAVGTCVVVALWAVVLVRLGYLTDADVRAWRKLSALRGYARHQGRLERAADSSPLLRRLREELDLRRLLAVAERAETEIAFLGRTIVVALLGFTAVVVVDTSARLRGGEFAVPPWSAVLVGFAVILLRLAVLRSAASRRRDTADRALGDMMMLVAIMTDGRGLQVEDAVRILARCTTTTDLRSLVDGGWRRLVTTQPRSTAELYRAIGEEYHMPQFSLVADALTATNLGVAERDTYTRVARAVYQERLVAARVRAARSRILVTLPVAGMLIPLLLLLGAPTLQSISNGLGGG